MIQNMKGYVLSAPSPATAKYWEEVKDASNDVKLELISLLSTSLVIPSSAAEKPHKGWASLFCGVWKDSRSADEIMDDIYKSKTKNSNLDKIEI